MDELENSSYNLLRRPNGQAFRGKSWRCGGYRRESRDGAGSRRSARSAGSMRRAAGSRRATPPAAAAPLGIRPACGSTMMTGRCRPGRADADQRGATDVRVLVEDRLAADRIHRSGGRQHAMGDPPAEPETLLGVEIAAVAHPVPDRRRRRRSSPRRSLSTRVTYRRVTTGPRTISSPISPAGNSSIASSERIGPSTMRITFHWMPEKRRPTQRRRPAGFACRSRCRGMLRRQALRRPRSRPPAGPRWRRRACGLRLPGGCKPSCGGALRRESAPRPTARGGSSAAGRRAPRSTGPRGPKRPASRTPGSRSSRARPRPSSPDRPRRPRGVHVGNHRGDAHRAVEQAEQRKARQIDLAGPDAVAIADLLHLGVEIAVREQDALGRTGAAGREDDRRRIVGGRASRAVGACRVSAGCAAARSCVRAARLRGAGDATRRRGVARASCRPRTSAGRPSRSAGLGKPAPKQGADRLGQGNRHESFRLGLGQAADQVAAAHAGVDQNRHRAGLEQAENQRDEIDARPEPATPAAFPARRPCATVPGRSGRYRRRVGERLPAGSVVGRGRRSPRLDHGHRVGPRLGHCREPPGDVVGSMFIILQNARRLRSAGSTCSCLSSRSWPRHEPLPTCNRAAVVNRRRWRLGK